MSHKALVFSAPGTALIDCTVGELVAQRPGRSRVFQEFGIDFCCQGGRTVRQACERKGLDPETLLEQLEAELAAKDDPRSNPATLPPAELAAYIIERHHGFLRRELPRLHAMAQRVAQVHGAHTPSLFGVYNIFSGLGHEMVLHMKKEEEVLFPAIVALARKEIPSLSLQEPISCMMEEHQDSGESLACLRELTNGFEPPLDACNTYRALFSGLRDLEEDLHRHIHLENSVLFPTALEMTKE